MTQKVLMGWVFGISSLLVLATQVNAIVINADDLLRFDVRNLNVKSGEQVEVTLRNTGRLKNHGHNFVLLKQGTEMGNFGRSDQSPTADSFLREVAIAWTPVATAGSSTQVRFTAPAPGSYTFVCSWPGHQSLSKGTLVVE